MECNMVMDSSIGKMEVSIEATTKEEQGKEMESSIMEIVRASAEESGGKECFRVRESTNSLEGQLIEWFGETERSSL